MTQICDSGGICTSTGRPKPMKKVSLAHSNARFVIEIQVDFTFQEIRGSRCAWMVITDTGTGYTECKRMKQRTITIIIEAP